MTTEGEIVWEYINPENLATRDGIFANDIFRGYRYPYDWVPQRDAPKERAVAPLKNGEVVIEPVGD